MVAEFTSSPTIWRMSARLLAIGLRTSEVVARRLPRLTWLLCRGDRDGALADLGTGLALLAERLGPVFVKIAQMASYRADLFPGQALVPLQRLQERVESSRSGEAALVLESLRGSLGDLLLEIDSTPIGAGSVALVFRARLRDDADCWVAIKHLRPRVRERVELDLACMSWLVGWISQLSVFARIPMFESFSAIARMIAAQCDLKLEAERLERLRSCLEGCPGVEVPKVREGGARNDVLVMQFMTARHRLLDSDLPVAVHRNASRRLLRALYRMMFQRGLVHCDLHPGNVLIDDDGTAILVDGGLMAEISIEDRVRFREFFLAFAQGAAPLLALVIIDGAVERPESIDRVRLEYDVKAVLSRFHRRTAGSFLVVEFVFQIFEVQRKHGLYGAPGFLAAIWALVMYEGLVRETYPDLDFQAEARPFLLSGLIESVRATVG